MKVLLLISILTAACSASVDWYDFITYNKLPGCEVIDLNTSIQKRLEKSVRNIEKKIEISDMIIRDYLKRKNDAQKTITLALVGGAGLATHRDIILSSSRSDLQKMLSVSQIMQGYGYAMYQYDYISQGTESLNCSMNDFHKALKDANKTNILVKSELRTMMNKSLRCITRWLHPINKYSPIVYANYLHEMIDLHFNVHNDAEKVNIALRNHDNGCRKISNELIEKRKKVVMTLDNLLMNISKKIDEPDHPPKTKVYGGAIIFGSLLQIFGQSMLDHQSEGSNLRNEEVANYGSLALYGAGFGWPSVIENTLYPHGNECNFGKRPVESLIDIFNLQNIHKIIGQYEDHKVVSAILEFKKVIQIRMSCYRSRFGDLDHEGQLSLDKLDELEEIMLLQAHNEVACINEGE